LSPLPHDVLVEIVIFIRLLFECVDVALAGLQGDVLDYLLEVVFAEGPLSIILMIQLQILKTLFLINLFHILESVLPLSEFLLHVHLLQVFVLLQHGVQMFHHLGGRRNVLD